MGEKKSAKCEYCGNPFEPAKSWSRFCSEACRIRSFRQREKSETPTYALERALLDVLGAVRKEQPALEQVKALRGALDSYEATIIPRSTATTAMVDGVPLATEETGDLFARAAAKHAPPPSKVKAKTLLERFQDATAEGSKHTSKSIALACGLKDGSSFSKWRAGGKLSQSVQEKLEAWLTKQGA